MPFRAPRLALLIDAENAPARIADALFREIEGMGDAIVRRIYGDFTNPALKGWTEILARFALSPRQQFSSRTGKNSADIALVIDAMDLLHQGTVDGFCLVSSDSDFAGLACRIREQGRTITGFGEGKTPETFRQACTRFVLIDPQPVTPTAHLPVDHTKRVAPSTDAIQIISRIVSDIEPPDAWVNLGQVGKRLANLPNKFSPKQFGYAKLSDLVAAVPDFECRRAETGAVFMRHKSD